MFSLRLKQLRKEKKVTQEELARILGLERSNIGKYEGSSGVIPSMPVLFQIADCFNVTLDYLLGRTDEKRPVSAEVGAWMLTADEAALLEDYRALNAEGKAAVSNTAHGFVLSGAYKKAPASGQVQEVG